MTQAIIAAGFNGVQFEEVTRNDGPWLRANQIGLALKYKNPDLSVSKIYRAHSDEFTDSMTTVVTLPTPGGPQETRIFSLRGCHLLAMFARTPVAKAFRVWVLDVLETLNKAEQRHQPALDAPITPDQQCTLQAIVKAKVEAIPKEERSGGIYPQLWSRFNNHFRLSSYKQLPQNRMSEAVAYLSTMEVRQKALPESKVEQLAIPEPERPHRYNEGEVILSELDAIQKELFQKSVTFMEEVEALSSRARICVRHPRKVSNVGTTFDIFLDDQCRTISGLAEQAYSCGLTATRIVGSIKTYAPHLKRVFG